MLPNPTHRPTRSSCQTCASCEGEWIWSRQSTSLPSIATLAICPEPRLRHKLKIILEIQAYHYHLGSSSEWVCLHFNRGRERKRASQAFPRGEFTLYLHLQKKGEGFFRPLFLRQTPLSVSPFWRLGEGPWSSHPSLLCLPRCPRQTQTAAPSRQR